MDAIEYKGTDCHKLTTYRGSDSPSLARIFIPNAYYDEAANTFRYCNGYLLHNQSEFAMATTIAHELAHSIDPCWIAQGPSDYTFKYSAPTDIERSENEFPFKNLIQCLRSKESVGAERLSNAPLMPAAPPKPGPPKPAPPKPISHDIKTDRIPDTDDWESTVKNASNASEKGSVIKSPFCKEDQIGESFSDWVSAELLPQYIASNFPDLSTDQYRIGFSNAHRGECSLRHPKRSRDSVRLHPPWEKRTDKILLVQPEVRKKMGCAEEPPDGSVYCKVDSIKPIPTKRGDKNG